jgi:hypothetical protein
MAALEQASLVSKELSDNEKAGLFNNFVQTISLYVTNVYNPALLNDDDIGVLPKLYRFGYHLAVGQQEKESGNTLEYIAALKQAVRVYPEMKDVVEFLTKQVLEQFHGNAQEGSE